MGESIHGHAVMELMLASGTPYTKETLEQALHAKFGPEARYHTCSAADMTAREVIAFLAARGKFTGGEAGFQTDRGKICDH